MSMSKFKQGLYAYGVAIDTNARMSAIERDQKEREAQRERMLQSRNEYHDYMDIQKRNESIMNQMLSDNRERARQAEAERKQQLAALKRDQAEAAKQMKELEREGERFGRWMEQRAREEAKQMKMQAQREALLEGPFVSQNERIEAVNQRNERIREREENYYKTQAIFDQTNDNAEDIAYLRREIADLAREVSLLRGEVKEGSVLNYVPK